VKAPLTIRIGAFDTDCVLGTVESEPSVASRAELVDMAEHIDRVGGWHGG